MHGEIGIRRIMSGFTRTPAAHVRLGGGVTFINARGQYFSFKKILLFFFDL